MPTSCVTGLLWGDEGKGKIIDLLAEEADYVVRYGGGHNAGHTLVQEGERLVQNIGNNRVLMLRNHGPVVMAETLPAMFLNYYMLQRACEIQVKTSALGKPILVPPEVVEVHQRDRDRMLTAEFGKLDFEAWKRKLDRVDTGWRE